MKIKRKEPKIQYGTISLPLPLINKIKEKMRGTGMISVSSYVAFVLRQIFSASKNPKEVILTKSEEKEIKDRLRNLDYL
jgi:hypothetical protein